MSAVDTNEEESAVTFEAEPGGNEDGAETEEPVEDPTPAPEPTAKVVKKESFQWSTPADEFADDVGSDIEEDGGAGVLDDPRPNDGPIVVTLASADKPKKPKTKVKSKQQFPCPKCDKIWNWPWELRRHLIMHFKEKERQDASAYKCKECGKGFQWKRDLAQHMRLHTGEKLLVCSVCGKKFVTRQALLHHVVVHTGEKPFQCALCGNRFTQPANLRTHTKKKHDMGPIRGSKCPHCHETFPSLVAIHQHILEDHQNIVAEQREEVAMEKLKKEQEKLDKERKKKEIARMKEEKRRERMDAHDFRDPKTPEWKIKYEFHLGEGIVRGVDWDRTPSNGELACDECDEKFGWRYEIMFHRLCHMVDDQGHPKNKVCPECDTVFKVPIGLKHHLLLHTGELPFLCLHCWRSFSSHIDLKLHIRKEHLYHLDLPMPKPSVNKPKGRARIIDADGEERRQRRVKREVAPADAASGEAEPIQYAMINGQQVQIANMINENGETVQVIVQPDDGQFMLAGQAGGAAGEQAIMVGPDGTIVNTNNQDMIVVIQSDEYDGAAGGQGLVMVDPSQLQQIANGVPMTITQDGQMIQVDTGEAGEEAAVESGEGGEATAEMIVSDHHQAEETEGETTTQYVQFEVAGEEGGDDGQPQQVILSTGADGQQTANINGNSYVVVTADGEKQTLVVQEAAEEGQQETGGEQAMIVQEMMTDPEQETGGDDEATTVDPADTKAEIANVLASVAGIQSGDGGGVVTDEHAMEHDETAGSVEQHVEEGQAETDLPEGGDDVAAAVMEHQE